jgi:hypothetical protein
MFFFRSDQSARCMFPQRYTQQLKALQYIVVMLDLLGAFGLCHF